MFLKGLKSGGPMSLNKETVVDGLAKEELSLEALFITYKMPIYQFVYRYCQDEQLSIDIVQDTFIRFHRYQERFDEKKSSMKTYLFRMAYQLMINRIKKQNRMKRLLPFLFQQTEQAEVSLDDKLTVQAAIGQLPSEQRAVILLTYFHDLKQKEIAGILEIPVGTVKSRLHTSLEKLKLLMEVKE